MGVVTVGLTVLLTVLPARVEARRPIAEVLRQE